MSDFVKCDNSMCYFCNKIAKINYELPKSFFESSFEGKTFFIFRFFSLQTLLWGGFFNYLKELEAKKTDDKEEVARMIKFADETKDACIELIDDFEFECLLTLECIKQEGRVTRFSQKKKLEEFSQEWNRVFAKLNSIIKLKCH